MSTSDFTSDSPAPIGRQQADVHSSAVGPEPRFQTSQNESRDTGISNDATDGHQGNSNSNEDLGEDYPEQLHAGKVGIGPEYGRQNKETHGIAAKVKGFKEEVKGTITRNSELVQQGKDRRTGGLARKEEEKNDQSPFDQGQDQNASSQAPTSNDSETNIDRKDRRESNTNRQESSNNDYTSQRQYGDERTETNSDAVNNQDQAPFSDRAAREQAATTYPEGTSNAQQQAEEGADLQRNAQMNAPPQYSF